MCFTMKERKPIFREYSPIFQKASKKEKGNILNELEEITGCHRKHIAWVLRNHGKKVFISNNTYVIGDINKKRKKPKRPIIYDAEFVKALKFLWIHFDCINSKRLKSNMKNYIQKIYQFNEYKLTDDIEKKLLKISHGKIDNLLKKERERLSLTSISHTKPGSLLKHQIPIRTHADWNEKEPGFLEIDLVGHDGGNVSGDFCYSLNTIDINTCWCDFQAIKNKAHVWCKAAIVAIRSRLPFELKGIDTDCGAEFINYLLFKYCDEEKIQFTRGRSYRKNDNCYIEQKNCSVIRKAVFHYRYDTEEELDLLNKLYNHLRLYVNYFMPSNKLIEKIRIGNKTKKIRDPYKTPYERVLESEHVKDKEKVKLTKIYNKINPFELKRKISNIQDKLIKSAERKNKRNEIENNL